MRQAGVWCVMALTFVLPVRAGELKKDYFAASQPGRWAEYQLVGTDGTKSTSSNQRNADADGHPVVEAGVKIEAGPGAGAESKTTVVLPRGFNLARDWLSYGVFTEKMTMQYGSVSMPIEGPTLEAIRKSSKDYRGAVTFEATETVAGHRCDRYAYTVAIAGPAPQKESGQLWLDETVPFGIVRQVAKTLNADGSVASSFEITLTRTGGAAAAAPAPVVEAVEKAAPAELPLVEAYQAGRIGLDVAVDPGSGGRRLRLTFRNKTESDLTVTLAAGSLSIPASDPIGALKVVVAKAARVPVPASATPAPLVVTQQPGRGVLDGSCELSVYEGTPLFSGSVTRGTVPR